MTLQKGDMQGKKKENTPYLFSAFGSLFQGDHLGVEFVLQSHEQLLVQEGLLEGENRVRGHQLLPWGPNYEGLIIDEYFAIGSHPLRLDSSESFPFLALARARAAYDKHHLDGPIEKDTEAANEQLAYLDLASRLSGNWVSTLLFRRLSSLVDGFFAL